MMNEELIIREKNITKSNSIKIILNCLKTQMIKKSYVTAIHLKDTKLQNISIKAWLSWFDPRTGKEKREIVGKIDNKIFFLGHVDNIFKYLNKAFLFTLCLL